VSLLSVLNPDHLGAGRSVVRPNKVVRNDLSSRVDVDIALTTCSADDLVVHKVFAGRDLDWGDVERILIRRHGKLNLDQIRCELKPLLELKGETNALAKLDQKLTTVERRLRTKP